MGFSLSKSLVKRGLSLRRHRSIILALSFFPVFLLSLVLLAAFFGTRSYNLLAVLFFAFLLGLIPFLSLEAIMLVPVKFLKFKLETGPTQVIELGCPPETATSRVWRAFAGRKIQAKYLKHFTGHEGFVLDVVLGAGKTSHDETIISFNPFFAIKIGRNKSGTPVAAMYYEKDRVGLTLAETLKAKLMIA